MSKIRIGFVGCGDIAGYTAQVSKFIPQVKLVACCDVDTDRLNSFAMRHRIPKIYTKYDELLVRAEVEAVYLAVPHHLHYEMILSAVEAGKPVLVEKPVTRTLDEAKKLVAYLSDQKVGVNYQYRYDKGCYALARAVQAGVLGRVHSIRINIPWHRTQSYFDNAPWHQTIAKAGGGTLITQGSHFLDVALWALGEVPVSAVGYTASPGFEVEVETLVQGIVETRGGTLINITSSIVAATEQAVTIEVYGEEGTALYRNLPLPSLKIIGLKVQKEKPPVWGFHALHRSLAGFANWVINDKPFLTPAHDTLPVHAAVDGIYRSAQSKQKEEIDL